MTTLASSTKVKCRICKRLVPETRVVYIGGKPVCLKHDLWNQPSPAANIPVCLICIFRPETCGKAIYNGKLQPDFQREGCVWCDTWHPRPHYEGVIEL